MNTPLHAPWRWMAPHGAFWLREQFGESHLLFNPASNETHILNDLAIATLEQLRQAPANGPELLERLGVDPQDVETARPYARLLRDLDLLGLILPVDS
ncbi:MAG: HPr-rel-A system PqqD family peptide chaperone [Magnetococcales bacterium]|nr:HPr-rel-A system PqqD family peptide chaperone [Magnetococcales bacterium]